MNVTATTRLTADECLTRLDALRPMPRGVRMAAFASSHPGEVWTPGRHTLWQVMFYHCVPRSVLEDPDYDWPDAGRIKTWASPVRRLREERRALREELSRTQTALARSNGELAGATERLGHHLYCAHHDTFNCTMVCASALLGEP